MDQDPKQGSDSEDIFDSDDVHGGGVDDDDEALEPPGINVDDWDDMNAHLGGEVGAAVVGAEEEEGQVEVFANFHGKGFLTNFGSGRGGLRGYGCKKSSGICRSRAAASTHLCTDPGFFFSLNVMNSVLINVFQRVAAWHNMIGPKLEAVELRKNFDIHEYGW